MTIYFSPTRKGFYPSALKEDYIKSNTWPSDLVEVSESEWNIFGKAPSPADMEIGFTDGNLYWKPIALKNDLLVKRERNWRDLELQRSDIELYKVQDSDANSFGSVSEWRNYRKMLREWPVHLEFPKQEFRPQPPDAK